MLLHEPFSLSSQPPNGFLGGSLVFFPASIVRLTRFFHAAEGNQCPICGMPSLYSLPAARANAFGPSLATEPSPPFLSALSTALSTSRSPTASTPISAASSSSLSTRH